MKILIADDTGTLGPTAIVFLSFWGHQVQSAHDGVDALVKAHAWRPDLVLVRLERMDGITLTAALLASADTARTRVVLAGPPEDKYSRRRSEVVGASGYLSTPLAVPELRDVVRSLQPAEEPLVASGRRASR